MDRRGRWALQGTSYPPSQPYGASLIDATAEIPDAVRLLGFFVPIFYSASIIDAKRQNRRVGGI